MKKEIKLVEVCASFSRKLNAGNYESRDFFCSHKEECKPEDAEATYRRIFHFCRTMVEQEVDNYIEQHKEPVIQVDDPYANHPPMGRSIPKEQGKKSTYKVSQAMQENKQEQAEDHGRDNITEEWVEDQQLRNK